MASADARNARASSSEHTTGRAAARYLDADVASTTDVDDNIVEVQDDDVLSDGGRGGRACTRSGHRPPASYWSALETLRQSSIASRPGCHGASQRQPSSNGRGVSNGRSNPVLSRCDSSEGSHNGAQQQPDAAAYGPQPSTASAGLAPLLQQQHSSGSVPNRRHPNGLPARHPAGPLPGIPYMSDLVTRYPMRQAPASGPQISLVSGQLYVSERLRDAVSTSAPAPTTIHNFKKAPPAHYGPAPAAGGHGYGNGGGGGFPTPDMLIPSYSAEMPFVISSYLQQRRAEKEQRAFFTAQHNNQQQQQALAAAAGGGRATTRAPPPPPAPDAGRAGPSATAALAPLPACRVPSAATEAAARNDGGGGGGGGAGGGGGLSVSSRQREVREGVERWLETSDSFGGEQDAAAAAAGRRDSSSDPSRVYRHYGIFRTYAKQSQGSRSPLPMPTAMTTTTTAAHRAAAAAGGGGGGGHRVAFDRDRTSSGAGGVSPMRPTQSYHATTTVTARAPPRQSAW
ncbi:hypothetical protein PLESTB_001141700 [Pleodorina starrii]|uniref:Uncharacterized protein n=1 Tax=Pleodorina starrii TaxID=330485 RepID=A0A9W6BRU3_9CHLO|nr:hypothetical protein PLESTM_000562900 [Pleodorina starrii]GLC56750.1 hypothetical protein PLESTB_001141700 [Pleodorina starrii]GLC66906.1 hypothetical protein PLESTF_000489000 [Pleodorina starrii]